MDIVFALYIAYRSACDQHTYMEDGVGWGDHIWGDKGREGGLVLTALPTATPLFAS